MKKRLLSLLALAALGTCADTFDVTRFGARPDDATDNTAAIQKAIDACSAKGGGRVLVPGGGVYKTYTLNLKNNVDLHIDRGATLKGGEDPLKYPEFGPTDVWRPERSPRFNKRALFYTVGQTNVAITGAGTIDGNAEAFHRRVDGRWQRISHTNITGRCVFFVGCRDVRFDDVLVHHPCGWSTWFLDCDRVQCRGVRIACHREFPNGDGLHFGGCRDVTVSDCLIDAQDDALIVRTHQEQMRTVRPCERLVFANCVLRSNQSAIRIGWTGDGPIRDVSFDNIVCPYSRLGVQFYLPAMGYPLTAKEHIDPPRGRGVVPPAKGEIVPFSVENMRFSNMTIDSFHAPLYVSVGRSENVAFLRNIAFSNCRFRAQRPPVLQFRPEDNVRDWRFSNVTFEIAKPRGSAGGDFGVGGAGLANGWFENARDVVFDNVKWSFYPQDLPEWTLTLEQAGSRRPVRLAGARQDCREETPAPGVRRFVCDRLTDGCQSWDVQVCVEARTDAGGTSYTGRIANNDAGIRVTAFEGPYFERVRLDPADAALYLPQGMGRRVTAFPEAGAPKIPPAPAEDAENTWENTWQGARWYALRDGRYTFDTGFHPGATGLTMPWMALDSGYGTLYVGAHDPKAQPKRLRLRWTPNERRIEAAFDHRLFLEAGGTWEIPETVCARVAGDWHAAAKRYRAWYDTAREIRTAAPAWTQDVTGWLLVIMRQQNGEAFWKYTDLPLLCDVAARNGLTCIGLFGWTKGGHDHLYPDYEPSDEMGGVAALKAGIAEARRRGIRVCIYANGQLQQVGATEFWREHGERLALVKKDGTRVIQTYHKYRDIPKYAFALGCLYGKPWHDRMLALARQAADFGADGILYDQLGIFAPFACYGTGHGHPAPSFSYAEERPAFMRSIADAMQKTHPGFAVLTEGLHDTILDSTALFHGCEYGVFAGDVQAARARATNPKVESFPELWRYTFPELVTTVRLPTPMCTRAQANFAAVFGLRSEIEVRYGPDRAYVLDGKVPTKADYGTVVNVPDLKAMASVPPAVACAGLKAVCDFQRAHAKYLLRGRFVDGEGFSCPGAALVAKRFVAADGTSAVCVWNVSDAPVAVKLECLGAPTAVAAPGVEPVAGPLAANALRLYTFAK